MPKTFQKTAINNNIAYIIDYNNQMVKLHSRFCDVIKTADKQNPQIYGNFQFFRNRAPGYFVVVSNIYPSIARQHQTLTSG